MSTNFKAQLIVPLEHKGKRLDQSLALLCPEHSRARLTAWVKTGQILVNGQSKQPKDKVQGGEEILIQAEQAQHVGLIPEKVDFGIIYEDDDLMVVNKPNGLVVHPAAGNATGTLLNGLIYHCPDMVNLPRAGIVHRLDKGTTGLMVVAKSAEAHTSLVRQIHDREVHRYYRGICYGLIKFPAFVCQPIGRHPTARTKMAVVEYGKYAKTTFEPLEHFSGYTDLSLKLETGRTHQIRVHLAHIKHPLLGDETYCGRNQLSRGLDEDQLKIVQSFNRPALHAHRLSFVHPTTNEQVSFEAPLPDDYELLRVTLRKTD